MREQKSIEQLENDYWKEIDFPSSLVERCFAYRKIPVSALTTEQLRVLIGQQIGLPYIVPKAVTILQKNILAEGDHYPGDLLNALLQLPEEGWSQSPDEKITLLELLREKIAIIEATENRQLVSNVKAFLT